MQLLTFADIVHVVKWYTRYLEGVVPSGVGVRLPPCAHLWLAISLRTTIRKIKRANNLPFAYYT